MSLILEALNKAEQNNITSGSYTVPQVYPIEKKALSKWLLLLLLATACIISAIATFLIIKNISTNDAVSGEGIQTSKNQPPAITRIKHQQLSPEKNVRPSYRQQIQSQPENAITAKQLSIKAEAKPPHSLISNGWDKQRKPGLHNLVENPKHSKVTRPITDAATAVAYDNFSGKSDRQNNQGLGKINNISKANDPQLADIKISVHMYSEIAAKRFIYIDSIRYSEGSTLSGNIIIDEITKNGIVINKNGILYRLPIKL